MLLETENQVALCESLPHEDPLWIDFLSELRIPVDDDTDYQIKLQPGISARDLYLGTTITWLALQEQEPSKQRQQLEKGAFQYHSFFALQFLTTLELNDFQALKTPTEQKIAEIMSKLERYAQLADQQKTTPGYMLSCHAYLALVEVYQKHKPEAVSEAYCFAIIQIIAAKLALAHSTIAIENASGGRGLAALNTLGCSDIGEMSDYIYLKYCSFFNNKRCLEKTYFETAAQNKVFR